MSAIEAFQKPKIVWPELPIELWIRILRCATSLPEDFDLELVRGAFPLQYASKLYREVLVTARKIVRVSKLWNDLATPFLYETIWIAKERQLVQFHAALRKSPKNHISVDPNKLIGKQATEGSTTGTTPTRRQPVGFWVRRLVITIQPSYTLNIDITSEILDLVTCFSGGLVALHLLVPLPNHPNRFISPAFLHVLETHNKKTLRCLNLTSNEPDPAVSLGSWYAFLEEMESMYALRCDVRCDHTRPDIFYKPHNLSVISIPMVEFVDAEFPNTSVVDGIHELIITKPHVLASPDPSRRLGLHVPQFGDNLTTLTLDMHTLDPHLGVSLCLSPFFPDLIYLRLSCRSWDALHISHPLTIPSSVIHLRLSSLHQTSTNKVQYTYLDHILETIYLEGSSLKVIQLGGRPFFNDLAQRHSSLLHRMAEKVRGRGLELRDPDDSVVV